jgi:hypothetical protein
VGLGRSYRKFLGASGTLHLLVGTIKYSGCISIVSTDHGTTLTIYMQIEGEGITFRKPVFHGTFSSPEAFERFTSYLLDNSVRMEPEGYYKTTRTIEMQQGASPEGTQFSQGSICVSPRDIMPLTVDLEFYWENVYDSRRIWLDNSVISINIESD